MGEEIGESAPVARRQEEPLDPLGEGRAGAETFPLREHIEAAHRLDLVPHHHQRLGVGEKGAAPGGDGDGRGAARHSDRKLLVAQADEMVLMCAGIGVPIGLEPRGLAGEILVAGGLELPENPHAGAV